MSAMVFYWNGASGSLQDRYGNHVTVQGTSRDAVLFQCKLEFMRLYPNYYSDDIRIQG